VVHNIFLHIIRACRAMNEERKGPLPVTAAGPCSHEEEKPKEV
jgi:hypothetical protein